MRVTELGRGVRKREGNDPEGTVSGGVGVSVFSPYGRSEQVKSRLRPGEAFGFLTLASRSQVASVSYRPKNPVRAPWTALGTVRGAPAHGA